jgi:hypothetical protein
VGNKKTNSKKNVRPVRIILLPFFVALVHPGKNVRVAK